MLGLGVCKTSGEMHFGVIFSYFQVKFMREKKEISQGCYEQRHLAPKFHENAQSLSSHGKFYQWKLPNQLRLGKVLGTILKPYF